MREDMVDDAAARRAIARSERRVSAGIAQVEVFR